MVQKIAGKKVVKGNNWIPPGQIPEKVARKIIDGAIASWKKDSGKNGVPLDEHIQKLKDYYSKNSTHVC